MFFFNFIRQNYWIYFKKSNSPQKYGYRLKQIIAEKYLFSKKKDDPGVSALNFSYVEIFNKDYLESAKCLTKVSLLLHPHHFCLPIKIHIEYNYILLNLLVYIYRHDTINNVVYLHNMFSV